MSSANLSKKPSVPALPDPDRRERLAKFLAAFEQHHSLAHYRAALRTGEERQLALFAALERAVLVGPPAATPPSPDDEADQLLCDLLDVIDNHPELKNCGAHYGPDRHLINLQAFGIWKGDKPLSQPTARELFATLFADRTSCPATTWPAADANNSPPSQDFSPNGELIVPLPDASAMAADAVPSSQTLDGVLVVPIAPGQEVSVQSPDSSGMIRHETSNPGEKPNVGPPGPGGPAPPMDFPHRTVRRGRPIKLDDFAKGRLLGLMSHGLSFRQAAAQLGVHHQTLLNALKRDEDFAQQVSEARLDAISQPLLTVVQASRTNWRAAAWLAKFLSDRRASTYETTPEERELNRRN